MAKAARPSPAMMAACSLSASKSVALVFARPAFLPTPSDRRTFHQRALQEARYYEQRVATNLSNLVFGQVFPALARAVADRWH